MSCQKIISMNVKICKLNLPYSIKISSKSDQKNGNKNPFKKNISLVFNEIYNEKRKVEILLAR